MHNNNTGILPTLERQQLTYTDACEGTKHLAVCTMRKTKKRKMKNKMRAYARLHTHTQQQRRRRQQQQQPHATRCQDEKKNISYFVYSMPLTSFLALFICESFSINFSLLVFFSYVSSFRVCHGFRRIVCRVVSLSLFRSLLAQCVSHSARVVSIPVVQAIVMCLISILPICRCRVHYNFIIFFYCLYVDCLLNVLSMSGWRALCRVAQRTCRLSNG